MALVATDLKYFLTGGGSNSDPDASIGGARSTTEAGSNLFDLVTGRESAPGDTEYRCIILQNTHASLTASAVEAYFNGNTVTPANQLSMGLDSAGKNGAPAAVADEDTAPTGVTFSQPTLSSPLAIPDLEDGDYIAIWIRRIVAQGQEAVDDVMATITTAFDTRA